MDRKEYFKDYYSTHREMIILNAKKYYYENKNYEKVPNLTFIEYILYLINKYEIQ